MTRTILKATSTSLLTCAAFSTGSVAQEQEKASYIYATYFNCDVTLQERADEIFKQLDQPLWDAAIGDGTVTAWGDGSPALATMSRAAVRAFRPTTFAT